MGVVEYGIFPIFQNYKKQVQKFTIELRDRHKREYDNWLFNKTDFKKIPEDVKKEILSEKYGYKNIQICQDLSGKDRYAVGTIEAKIA